jgi:hypothetical protein
MGGLSTGDNTLADLIYATQEVVNTREGTKALLSWIVAQGIGTALVDRARQALVEWRHGSFNGKFRDECIPVEDICRKARRPTPIGRRVRWAAAGGFYFG